MSETPTLQRILYIEDEQDIREIAQIALESVGGFDVLICGSGAEGLAAAQDFNPDLILLDVMMPDMDGPGVLTALRAIDSIAATPIVFMTAKIQPKEIERYLDLGAADVIAKPFDPMTLSDRIRDIWREAHGP